MIVIDVGEKPYVFEAFDKLGIEYIKEEIRVPQKCNKTAYRNDEGELVCINNKDLSIIEVFMGQSERDDMACIECAHESVRIGDFTNEHRSFIAERKRVDDFYASMVDGRLYEQARKMYSYCSGLKIIILEGMSQHKFLQDSTDPFNSFNEVMHELRMQSPLEQLMNHRADKQEWIMSTLEDLASCEVALVQSWNITETAIMIERIAKGSGTEPKVRSQPKKVSGVTLEEQMLICIPRIGKMRAQDLVKEYGSLSGLITAIRKMPKKEAEKRSITKKLKELFG